MSDRCVACGNEYERVSKRQQICGLTPFCSEIIRASLELGVPPADYIKAHRIRTDSDGIVGGGAVASLRSDIVTQNVPSTHLKFLCWPDTHFPYGDPRAISLGLQIVKYYEPDIIFLMGDMLDAQGFSSYTYPLADPRSFLRTELDDWKAFASRLRAIAPKADMFYLEGNHEARLEKWGWRHPQLTDLEEFELSNLLKLKEFGFANDGKTLLEASLAGGKVLFTHGTHVGANKAGFAARFEMARYGLSGFSGHTHRLASYFERSKNSLKAWHECGHMQVWQPHYLKYFPNWQQGLAIGEASRDGNDFEGETIPFRTTYRCRVRGKEFSA